MSKEQESVTLSDLSDLSDLSGADLVRVTDNHDNELARITDADQIEALARVLAEREDGWGVPADGVRVMKLRLNFSSQGASLGSLGVGHKYLVAQRRGGFYQRDAEPGDRARILEIVGLTDPEG